MSEAPVLELDHPIMNDIRKLAGERVHRIDDQMLGRRPLTRQQAIAIRTHLSGRPYRAPEDRVAPQPPPPPRQEPARPAPQAPRRREERQPKIPDGRYATPSLTGNQDLDFWVLETDKKDGSKWYGMQFVRRVLGGGHGDTLRTEKVRDRATRERALKAIREMGIDESQLTFARELAICRKCGRTLTNEESRLRGEGPGPHIGD